ncbi:translation initiation factor 4E, partial [Tremellales sp. Uapishka_1]
MSNHNPDTVPSTTSSQSSSILSTPLCTRSELMSVSGADETPGVGKGKEEEKEKEKGSMPPPAVPASAATPAPPPRMTRLPSLQQLSNKFHGTPASSPALTHQSPTPSKPILDDDKPVTPPQLKISTNPAALTTSVPGGLNNAPFAPSPSSRLKLPISALTRTHSSTRKEWETPSSTIPGDKESESNSTAESSTHHIPFGEAFASGSGSVSGSEGTTMSRAPSVDGHKGYKDVPSLDQIRQRVSRGLSFSGAPVPAIAEAPAVKELEKEAKIEEETPPSSAEMDLGTRKKKEHPLQHSWTLFFDSKSHKPDPILATPKEGDAFLGDWEKSLVTVGRFDTVEGFARHLNNIRLPSQLAKHSNYHMFKNGIRPMWEDPANARGGKWVLHFKAAPAVLDGSWANLTMAMVGEILDPDDEVCGIVVSSRPRIDRLQIWTRGREDVEKVNQIGKRIMDTLALEGRDLEVVSMEFQFNAQNTTAPPNRYIHIPFPPSRNSLSHAPPTPSRLGTPTPGLSPTTSHFPPGFQLTPPTAGSPGLVPQPPSMRRTGSTGAGANAFSGPMGGMGSRTNSFSGRKPSVQSLGIEGK